MELELKKELAQIFRSRRLQMGYMLNSLGSLPIDEDVKFYIFVINGTGKIQSMRP